jgi:hypothetical protein
MFSLRGLFPSFEKPVERPRYLNLQPARRDFRGIGIVLFLAASCGVALALWEPSTLATTPFVTASVPRSAPVEASKTAISAPAEVSKAAIQETTAAAEADDDQATPTVKRSVFCSQRTTARRDCADVKALKEARLKAPEPVVPSKTEAAPVAAKAPDADQPAPASAPAKAPEPVIAANAQPEAPAAQAPQRTATAPKAKRPRAADDAPVERLVRVYDQILPDGRRVPVYRRAGGGYETGTIVDGEYRPLRRATLEPPYGARRFGLQ